MIFKLAGTRTTEIDRLNLTLDEPKALRLADHEEFVSKQQSGCVCRARLSVKWSDPSDIISPGLYQKEEI